MHAPSPLVRCVLALALVFAQAAAALHGLEHLVPDAVAGAPATELVVASGSPRPAPSDARATPSAHADGGDCALCLVLGAAQAHARSIDAVRVSVVGASAAHPESRSAMPAGRSTRAPPARAPPVLS